MSRISFHYMHTVDCDSCRTVSITSMVHGWPPCCPEQQEPISMVKPVLSTWVLCRAKLPYFPPCTIPSISCFHSAPWLSGMDVVEHGRCTTCVVGFVLGRRWSLVKLLPCTLVLTSNSVAKAFSDLLHQAILSAASN